MGFKYSNDNIPEAIVKVLLENKKAKHESGLHQGDIKRRIGHILGHEVGYRQLRKNLTTMKDQKLLDEYDLQEGKRGYKVYYSPTNKAEKMYNLKILGSNETVEKRKNLYQLLIFFEVFKISSPLTRRQLGNFLKQIGKSIDNLDEAKVTAKVTHFRPIKCIEIIKWIQNDSKVESNAAIYHVAIPGFTVKEVTTYLQQLRRGKEPRPIRSYSAITDVPFTIDVDYFETEIVEAIESFRQISLIKSIDSIFPGETRYSIADRSLVEFAKDVWLIHDMELRLLFEKLVYEGRPRDEIKKYLMHVYSKRITDRILITAFDTRRLTRKRQNNAREKEEAKKFIQSFDRDRRSFAAYTFETHKNVIKEYDVINELIEGICFSPLIS